MAKDKVSMPSGIAGITRYFDDYKSKIEFKPGHVVIFIIVLIMLELILNVYGRGWFGL